MEKTFVGAKFFFFLLTTRSRTSPAYKGFNIFKGFFFNNINIDI